MDRDSFSSLSSVGPSALGWGETGSFHRKLADAGLPTVWHAPIFSPFFPVRTPNLLIDYHELSQAIPGGFYAR
jgi:hypothetical protein